MIVYDGADDMENQTLKEGGTLLQRDKGNYILCLLDHQISKFDHF